MTDIKKLIDEAADAQKPKKINNAGVSGSLSGKKKPLAMKANPVTSAVKSTLPNSQKSCLEEAIEASEAAQTWEKLKDFGDTIGQGIVMMADNIAQSVEIVRQHGCNNLTEFNVLQFSTNRDIVKFSEDYNKIRARHEGKTGRITDPEERRLMLSIFEDYNAFNAYFQGAMHHTLVAFTDFALQARDRAAEAAKQEEEKATDQPTQDPQA